MQRLAAAQIITVHAEGCYPHTHTCDKTNRMNSNVPDLFIEINTPSVAGYGPLTTHTGIRCISNTGLVRLGLLQLVHPNKGRF